MSESQLKQREYNRRRKEWPSGDPLKRLRQHYPAAPVVTISEQGLLLNIQTPSPFSLRVGPPDDFILEVWKDFSKTDIPPIATFTVIIDRRLYATSRWPGQQLPHAPSTSKEISVQTDKILAHGPYDFCLDGLDYEMGHRFTFRPHENSPKGRLQLQTFSINNNYEIPVRWQINTTHPQQNVPAKKAWRQSAGETLSHLVTGLNQRAKNAAAWILTNPPDDIGHLTWGKIGRGIKGDNFSPR